MRASRNREFPPGGGRARGGGQGRCRRSVTGRAARLQPLGRPYRSFPTQRRCLKNLPENHDSTSGKNLQNGYFPASSSDRADCARRLGRWSGSRTHRPVIDCEISSRVNRTASTVVARRPTCGFSRRRKRTRSGEFSFWTKPFGRFPTAVLEMAPGEASAATDSSPNLTVCGTGDTP